VSRFDDDESLLLFIFDKHHTTFVYLSNHYYYHNNVQSFDWSLAFVPLSFCYYFSFSRVLTLYKRRDYQLYSVCLHLIAFCMLRNSINSSKNDDNTGVIWRVRILCEECARVCMYITHTLNTSYSREEEKENVRNIGNMITLLF
jgi:hypothetical protein